MRIAFFPAFHSRAVFWLRVSFEDYIFFVVFHEFAYVGVEVPVFENHVYFLEAADCSPYFLASRLAYVQLVELAEIAYELRKAFIESYLPFWGFDALSKDHAYYLFHYLHEGGFYGILA